MGYDGVELAIRDPRLVDADELLRVLDANRLVVPAIGTGQAWGEEGLSFTDPDPCGAGARRLSGSRATSRLPVGSSAVVILGLIRGIVTPGRIQDQAMAWLIDALQECSRGCGRSRRAGGARADQPLRDDADQHRRQGLELIERGRRGEPGAAGRHLPHEHRGAVHRGEHPRRRAIASSTSTWPTRTAGIPARATWTSRRSFDALFATGYAGFVCGEFLPIPDAETAARRGIAHLRGLKLG